MVLKQFKTNRWAMGGLVVVAFFFLLALYAPFIANRMPFVWTDAQGITSFPLIRNFFAPADSRETLVELCFNYAALLLPIMAICFALIKNPQKRRTVLLIIATILAIPFITTQRKNQPADYILLQHEKSGHGVFAPLPFGPFQQTIFAPKTPPSWIRTDPRNQAYSMLGSDEVGRDVLARLLYGARVSLSVGFVAVGLSTAIGLLIGSLAGYFGGWIDIIISRLIEIIICFPSLFLILTIIAMLEKRSIVNIMLVIGLTSWTATARIIRGEVLKQRGLDYVAGAKALGAGSMRIIFCHILPNAIGPVLVGLSFGIAAAIFTESGLSFLGLGVSAPTATWGELLQQGRESPLPNWWLSVFPGIAIFLAMGSYNLVGEGLRDAMDPRLRS